MCDPLSLGIAAGTLAVGQAGMSYAGQNQQATANEQAANYNYSQQRSVTLQKARETDEQQSQNVEDTAIAAAKAQGQIADSAASQGLAPTSFVHALNTSMFGIGRQASAEDMNSDNARAQLGNELTGAEVARESQIARTPRPSGLSLALGVGQGALKGATTYQSAGGKF